MKLTHLTDKELVRNYISGDEKSFEVLLNRTKDKVFGYVISKVRDTDLTNDIFQDVFMKVVRTLKNGTYNEEGKFLPWVLTIAHNLVIDHFRKAKKMQMVSESHSKSDTFSIFSTLSLTEMNREEEMIKEQTESDVMRLTERLPKEQRSVLKDRIFREMSFKDIAERDNISINTALGRMRYALINLRKLVNKHNISITV